MDGTVLIADDDKSIRTVLTQAISRAGCRVHATSSLNTLMRWVEEGRGDVVISDVAMPDGNGLETLPKIHQLRPDLPVIIISAQNTITTAVGAAEGAAFDHLAKPFDLPDLMQRIGQALEKKRLKNSKTIVTSVVSTTKPLPLIGHSASMQKLFRLVAQVLNIDLPILITGETGTGKTALAKAIHELSERANGHFRLIAPGEINQELLTTCLNLPPNSTLLIDGVDECDVREQRALTQAFDELKSRGIRIISTATADLAALAAGNGFRSDLYYRLASVTIIAPPLRDRCDDIAALVEQFIVNSNPNSAPLRQFSADAISLLSQKYWPGNLRELESVVFRLLHTVNTPEISKEDVEVLVGQPDLTHGNNTHNSGVSLHDVIEPTLSAYFKRHENQQFPNGIYEPIIREIERPLIEMALDAAGGNQQKTAEILGINRNTLRKKINELEIEVTRRRKLM